MIYEFESLQLPQYVFVAQIGEHWYNKPVVAGASPAENFSVIMRDTLSWYDGSSNNWPKISDYEDCYL